VKQIQHSESAINAIVNKSETGIRAGGKTRTHDLRQYPRTKCKYCGGKHQREKTTCPAFGCCCRNCGRDSHFAKVCLQSHHQASVHVVSEDNSSDSGDSILYTVELSSENENVLAVQEQTTFQLRLFTTMKIKGGNTTKFKLTLGRPVTNLKNDHTIYRTYSYLGQGQS
jgi:hypothetical protein